MAGVTPSTGRGRAVHRWVASPVMIPIWDSVKDRLDHPAQGIEGLFSHGDALLSAFSMAIRPLAVIAAAGFGFKVIMPS